MADMEAMPKHVSFTKVWHTKPYASISPTRPELSANGKNVLITGGGTGIGNAIGMAFAHAGSHSVSILGRRLDKLESGAANISAVSEDTKVLYEVADVLDRSQLDAAFKHIVEKVGKIDILVSNAGYGAAPSPIVDSSTDSFVSSFETNVIGALNAVQAFMAFSGPDPVILNTSTALAHASPWSGGSVYSITKAANLKMMDYLALENQNIHVVNIQPGWVPTDMNGHQAEAPDVADLPGHFYVWLASPEARFLRGKFVWANWDVDELLERAEDIKSTNLLSMVLNGVPM